MVTFPAINHYRPLAGTNLYCLVTELHVCEQLYRGSFVKRCGQDSNLRPTVCRYDALTNTPLRHHTALWSVPNYTAWCQRHMRVNNVIWVRSTPQVFHSRDIGYAPGFFLAAPALVEAVDWRPDCFTESRDFRPVWRAVVPPSDELSTPTDTTVPHGVSLLRRTHTTPIPEERPTSTVYICAASITKILLKKHLRTQW